MNPPAPPPPPCLEPPAPPPAITITSARLDTPVGFVHVCVPTDSKVRTQLAPTTRASVIPFEPCWLVHELVASAESENPPTMSDPRITNAGIPKRTVRRRFLRGLQVEDCFPAGFASLEAKVPRICLGLSDSGANSGGELGGIRASLNSPFGRARPLNSTLPNTRIAISSHASQVSRNPCVFLGFGDKKRVSIPIYAQVRKVGLATCFKDPKRVFRKKFIKIGPNGYFRGLC